jgi:hypothetical protein
MTKLGKLWTGAVAYVSLLVGAGLSVAGNLADTYRIRGASVDTVDIVLAVGPPIATLLVAELFVSEWPRSWSLQTLRWVGMIIVGSLAAIVSWSHINELLAARGQNTLVSILWPLAIDGLAVMAMAKLLAMRVHRGHADTRTRWEMTADTVRPRPRPDTLDGQAPADMGPRTEHTPDGWTGPTATAADVVMSEAAVRGHDRWADLVATPDTDAMTGQTDVTDWADGHDRAIRDLGQELASEAERYVSATWDMSTAERTAVTPSLPRRTRTPSGASAPAEFLAMAAAWDPIELDRADMVKLSAAYFGVSDRTARRWLAAVTGAPTPWAPEA